MGGLPFQDLLKFIHLQDERRRRQMENEEREGDDLTQSLTPVTPPKNTQHHTQFTPNEIHRMIRDKIKKIIQDEDNYLKTHRPDLLAVILIIFPLPFFPVLKVDPNRAQTPSPVPSQMDGTTKTFPMASTPIQVTATVSALGSQIQPSSCLLRDRNSQFSLSQSQEWSQKGEAPNPEVDMNMVLSQSTDNEVHDLLEWMREDYSSEEEEEIIPVPATARSPQEKRRQERERHRHEWEDIMYVS